MVMSMCSISAWATSGTGGGSGSGTGSGSADLPNKNEWPNKVDDLFGTTDNPDRVNKYGDTEHYTWQNDMADTGNDVSNEFNYGYFPSNNGVAISGSTARAGTTIRGYVYNPEFQFIEATTPTNYDSAAQAHDYTTNGDPNNPDGTGAALPLQAVLQGGGGTFWVNWYVDKGTIDASGKFVKEVTDPSNPDAPWKDFGVQHMPNSADPSQEPPHTSDKTPDNKPLTTFLHAIETGELEDNQFYRYTVWAADYDPSKYSDPADIPETSHSDSITILVSTFGTYRYMTIDVDNDNRPSAELPNITGYLYWDTNPLLSAQSQLSQDSIKETSPIYTALLDAASTRSAADKSDSSVTYDPQNITAPTQLTITNLEDRGVDANGDKLPAYLYGLEILLPIDKTKSDLAALAEGDSVTVYRYNPDTGAVEELKGEVVVATDEDNPRQIIRDDSGNPVLSVKVTINGKSPNLGVFALGFTSAGAYEITSSADTHGQITPVGTHSFPIEVSPKFVTYPQDGYILDTISIRVHRGTNNSTVQNYSPAAGSIEGNTFTFDPSRYNVQVGNEVEVIATFKEADPSAEEFDVTISLQSNPSGSATAASILTYMSGTDLLADTVTDPANPGSGAAPTATTVQMDQTEGPVAIPSDHGLYLEFSPEPGFKLESLTINGEPFAVIGTSFYLSSIDSAKDIVVTYAPGLKDDDAGDTRKIGAAIVDEPTDPADPTGATVIDTAWVQDDTGASVKSTSFTVQAGNSKSIQVKPADDYSLRSAHLYKLDDQGNRESDYLDVTDLVNLGDNYDTLWLFNVVTDYEVDFSYKHIDSLVNFSVDQNKGGTINPVGNVPLESGERVRVVCTPWGTTADGTNYTVGSLTYNGTDITDYLTSRADDTYFTFTVMVSDTHNASDGVWTTATGGTETDTVLYISEKSATIVVSYDAKRGPAPAFMTISTKVGGIGGGQITPTQLVTKGEDATVWMFPDDGYSVKRVMVDGFDKTSELTNDNLKLQFTKVDSDHEVIVYYTNDPGKTYPKKYTIYPSTSSGGFISPDTETLVYGGESQRFYFFPMTGYYLDKVYFDGDEVDGSDPNVEFNGSSCLIKNITDDHKIHASFVREGSIDVNDTAFTVVVKSEVNGRVSPEGTLTVAAGASLPLSILPEKGYTYDKIYVKSLAGAGQGIDRADQVVKGVYTQYNIHDNYEITVTFRPLNPGETYEPEVVDRNMIVLTYENAEIDDGVTIFPDIDGLTFFKQPGTSYASTPGNFTAILDEGYDLDSVVANTEFQGKQDVNIIKIGDGVYSFVVNKEFITQKVVIEVHVKPVTPSSESVNLRTITVQAEGSGTISPSGTHGVFYVENGKSQTFYFFSDSGNRLETVYVNNVPVTVSDLSYTIASVTTNTNVRAVFVPGTQEPSVDDLGGKVNILMNREAYDGGTDLHGEVYPTNTTVIRGGQATFTFVPDAGYEVHVYEGSSSGNEITSRMTGNSIVLSGASTGAGSTANEVRYVAVFKPVSVEKAEYFNLTVTHGDHGWASPKGRTRLAAGESQTITIIPDAGYTVDTLTLNGVVQAGVLPGLTFTTPAASENMDVHVTFKTGSPDSGSLTLHTLTAYTYAGGVASPTSITAKAGTNATFNFMAVQDYVLQCVEIDGGADTTNGGSGTGFTLVPPALIASGDAPAGAVSSANGFTLNDDGTLKVSGVNADHTMIGIFKRNAANDSETNHHTIFVNSNEKGQPSSSGVGGRVSPDRAVTVPNGGNQSFTIIPEAGYKVARIIIQDRMSDGSWGSPVTVQPFTGASYTLFNVENDKIFQVVFEPLSDGETSPVVNTFDITATASVNGSISPSGTTQVAVGANAYFNFIPLYGYKLSYAVVDGVNVPASMIKNNQYVFANVQENHTIHAVYCLLTDEVDDFVTVIAGTPNGGTITPSGNVLVHKGQDASFLISNNYGYKLISIDVDGGAANAAAGGFTIGAGASSSSLYRWDGSTFTFKNIQADGHRLNATFELQGSIVDNADKYTTVTMIGNETGSGGVCNFPVGTTVIRELDASANEELDVSFIPDEGKSIKEIQITYADGTKRTLSHSDADAVWTKGYMSFTADQVNNGGITIAVTWQDITSEQQKDINDGKIKPARYHEIVSSFEGSGALNPAGRLKVANGASAVFTMVPDTGSELQSLTVDDVEVSTGSNTRVYTFKRGDNDDHTIHAAFSAVKEGIEYYTITGVPYGNGRVSPASVKVPAGESATIHFFPDDGYKLTSLEVGDDRFDYSSPSYTITNVSSDMEVAAFFNALDPGETPPSITPIDVVATVEGHGDVSPRSNPTADASVYEPAVTVPLGSSQKFTLIPDDGYEVDYIRFNDEILYVSANVSTYTVLPVMRYDKTTGAQIPNTFHVVYREKDTSAADIMINVSVNTDTQAVIGAGYTVGSGKVTPSHRVVPYGGSALFYIMPDPGSTIYDVAFDGQPLEWVGYADTGNLKAISGASASAQQAGAQTAAFAGVTQPGLMQVADNSTFYSVYTTTLSNVTHDGVLEVDFRKMTDEEKTKPFVDTHYHKLTVTSEGGGMVSPIGELYMPESGIESLRTKTFSGYYLESITVRYYDTDGNLVEEVDATDQLDGNFYKFQMGAYDTKIHVKFALIGTPSYVHAEMGDSKIPVYRPDGTQDVNPDGSLKFDDVACKVSPSLTNADGTPKDFVRGGTYTFTFDTTDVGPNGRGLVPEHVYYNGQEIPIVPGANFVTFPINASGKFDVIWRELREDEEPITPPGHTVVTEIAAGEGKVTPEPGMPERVPHGGATTVSMSNGEDGWVVSAVSDWYPEPGNDEPVEHVIPPEQYRGGSFTIDPVTCDHRIVISFVEVLRVYVEWDNSQGYVTPNTAPGEFLYIEQGTSIDFIVAPYFGYEVEGVWVDADERTSYLIQSSATNNSLVNQTGNRVIYFEDGQGVQGFTIGNGGSGSGGSGTGGSGGGASGASAASETGVAAASITPEQAASMAASPAATITAPDGSNVVTEDEGVLSGVMALFSGGQKTRVASTAAADAIADANKGHVGVDAKKTAFARAYSFSTPALGGTSGNRSHGDIRVLATFREDPNQNPRDAQFHITTSVIGDMGGTVTPTEAWVDEHGSITFDFHPESGFQVVLLKVNGNAMEYSSNSYTLTNVTADTTIEVGFDSIANPGTNNKVNRILRTLKALAATGDLNGPAIATLLVVAALSLFFVFLSSRRRKKEEEQRRVRRAAYNAYYYRR